MSKKTDEIGFFVRSEINGLRDLDPVEAIAGASEVHDLLLKLQADAAAVRREAVRDLRLSGWTLRAIADATGLSYQRIYQLEQGQDRKEKG